MNSYPANQSVLVLDNARIYHDRDLIEYIEAFGSRVEFLPLFFTHRNLLFFYITCFQITLQKFDLDFFF